jgi:putative tryptophan/tyrosine transport system substrate-binding protein
MNKKILVSVLTVVTLAFVHPAEAQQPKKVPRIGYLVISSLSGSESRAEAFRQGLRELGYIEGKNIVIEWRSADGQRERGPTLAEELVRLKVDVIVTGGPDATRPAKEATKTIPIVMAQDGDPVGNRTSLAWRTPAGTSQGCPRCLLN